MSSKEQGGVNQGELYTLGIRPLPFDLWWSWENVRLMCSSLPHSSCILSVYDHCLHLLLLVFLSPSSLH